MFQLLRDARTSAGGSAQTLTPQVLLKAVKMSRKDGGLMGIRVLVSSLSLAVALLGSHFARAGVNVNNGNFYVAYTDLYLPTAGLSIDVTRTYNSRSNYVKGFFGVGWSSEIEGFLKIEKAGISFYEGGGGNIIRFTPAGKDKWENSIFGPQVIKKIKSFYVLNASNGKDLIFNSKGQLTRVSDNNRNYIELSYSGERISQIKDNLNNQIKVKWGEFGKHPRIVALDAGRLKARYEYNKFGDLTKAIGADGIPYAYEYDDEHNMIKISYKDGKYKKMAYNKTRDWVTSFRDTDGMTTSYTYISDNLDPENKFGTIVVRRAEGSKSQEVSRFWYEFRKRADGSRYNYKAVTQFSNTVTETIFTECCGTPQVISQWQAPPVKKISSDSKWTVAKKDKKSTFFEYYDNGLLKKKTAPGGIVTELTYNPKHQKVSSVTRNGHRIDYEYDRRGNLAWAVDKAEKRRLGLTYDVKGRLTVIREQRFVGAKVQKRDVFFRYDANGRPIEIKEKSAGGATGTIKITYNNEGEVTGILGGNGRAVASEKDVLTAQRVAATFQSLLEIIKPAGVSLSPEG